MGMHRKGPDRGHDTREVRKMTENINTNAKREFPEVPEGRYVCKFAKCEFGMSKAGRQQLVTWFKIVEGDYKGQMLFWYQTTGNPTGMRIANDTFRKAQEVGIGAEGGRVEVNYKLAGPEKQFKNFFVNDYDADAQKWYE